MSTNLLIFNGGFVNKGAEAMVRCIQHGILSRLDHSSGSLGTSLTYSASQLQGLMSWPVPRLSMAQSGQLALWRTMGVLGKRPFRHLLDRYTCSTDNRPFNAVLDISGYEYHDGMCTGNNPLRRWLSARRAGVWDIYPLSGIPIYYLLQAWGPFHTREARMMADRLLAGATMVFARDEQSYQCLRELPSFVGRKVFLSSDIAFTFRGDPPTVGEQLLGEAGCRPDGSPLIGLVPNMRVYERTAGQGSDNVYLQCLMAVVEHFLQQHRDARVVIMPHEIRPAPSPVRDDRYLCQLMAQTLNQPERVFPLLGDYTAEQLKSVIGHLDLLISSRFHSIIAALSLRRPVVAVSWSHKYPQLLESVGLGEFTSSHEEITPPALVKLCQRVWAERKQLPALLEQHVPAHERSAESVLRRLAEQLAASDEGIADAHGS
jgi:polysaccharide pyruvyl transferase WcaK-like protein